MNLALKHLSDDELIAQTRVKVATERAATGDVVRHFLEIHSRRLFVRRGHASLFDMVTKEFGYCAGSAQLRINAMRLMRDVPAVEAKLDSGDLSLTAAAKIQTFLYAEKKSERPYSQSAKIDLVETCLNRSVLDLQREFTRRKSEAPAREPSTLAPAPRTPSAEQPSRQLEKKLARIKMLWSEGESEMSRDVLLERMADYILAKIDTTIDRDAVNTVGEESLHSSEVMSATSHSATSPSPLSRARRVRAPDDRRAKAKHEGCEFVSANGKRCGSQFQLEPNYIVSAADGGTKDASNTRLYCGQHHRLREFMRMSERVHTHSPGASANI